VVRTHSAVTSDWISEWANSDRCQTLLCDNVILSTRKWGGCVERGKLDPGECMRCISTDIRTHAYTGSYLGSAKVFKSNYYYWPREDCLSQPQGLIQPLLLHHHEALFKNGWILDGLYLTNGVRDNGVKVIIRPKEAQVSTIWRSISNIEQRSKYSAAFDYGKPITIISHRLFIQVTSICTHSDHHTTWPRLPLPSLRPSNSQLNSPFVAPSRNFITRLTRQVLMEMMAC
jgi:hypothetical protein